MDNFDHHLRLPNQVELCIEPLFFWNICSSSDLPHYKIFVRKYPEKYPFYSFASVKGLCLCHIILIGSATEDLQNSLRIKMKSHFWNDE